MKTRPPGRTGIQVSPHCLDTMMFGQVGDPDHGARVRITHRNHRNHTTPTITHHTPSCLGR
ncbi:hypothetical protein [Sphaerisporangium krabiense]|uniref:Aryl-alcohol dehydrogenase-like predicted oxidoreductase n=1 Tax=Sphaerisporangium krabiense TaxID=763782 RepID=A0A7W9DNQ7_9ACTN|nr:hypothetical protein [Sphaerisporangium krabiense]MBB5625254.1 aryl-alcohol dehydrogenase-like predicted oxidoreductase [Sphaerisporangium krabiense]